MRPVQRASTFHQLPLADVFGFFRLPLPEHGGATLRDWLTDRLARDPVEGDGVDWHGASFRVIGLRDGRIASGSLALLADAGHMASDAAALAITTPQRRANHAQLVHHR